MTAPLVSVIVPTKNSARTLNACLASIKTQTYPRIELIVVDNNSKDTTPAIAKKYADIFISKGPERSAQRNIGAKRSTGDFLLFIDSDMVVSNTVVQECVQAVLNDTTTKAVVIPEVSVGTTFWAACKAMERACYTDVPWMHAARFMSTHTFNGIGGYRVDLRGGEDFDLSQRINRNQITTITSRITHDEGAPTLHALMEKKWYYGKGMSSYPAQPHNTQPFQNQGSLLKRYAIFVRHWRILARRPLVALGMFVMKTCEFAAGGLGYATQRLRIRCGLT